MPIALVARHRGASVPHLQILDGDRLVLSTALRGGRVVVGRSDDADVSLPSDTVSRVHCTVERRDARWWLVDQSRHGTLREGEPVQEVALSSGDVFTLGAYRLRFVELPGDEGGGTATRLVRPADHEELLDVGDACATRRVELVVIDGPAIGAVFPCDRSRVRLGGRGAHVVLDAALPADAALLRVVRGRPVIEPGTRPVFLEGQRVREPTPVLDGERLRVGDHELEVRARIVVDAVDRVPGFGELVGSSEVMQRTFRALERIARHDATVLILGESGTGKELAARALHDAGARHDRPFVAVNCAAIPDQLVEAELFGTEKGAFTGATVRRDGAFQRADGGTLFLDEIGEMSSEVQAKLLRALESGEVRRVGGAEVEFPDVRVIAATHRPLEEVVEAGGFRRDLYYRLAVLTVALPPLRAHLDDLGEIAAALLARQHPDALLTREALRVLERHGWPGNVRELRNVLTRAVVLHGPRITRETLGLEPRPPAVLDDAGPPELEARRIREALERHGGNRAAAAKELGLARTSLLYKMRRHGIA